MSGNVVAWVFANFPINTAADRSRKIVLSEVAEAANRDFRNAHPGLASISAHWGFSRSTVIANLNWLVKEGWLDITERGLGRGYATVYTVVRNGSKNRTDNQSQKDQEDPSNGPEGNDESVQNAETSPSVSSVRDTPEETTRGARRSYDADFTRWWKVYPRNEDKGDASKAYLAARRRGASEEDLIVAAERYVKAKRAEGVSVKFLKHAATFLNSDRWQEWLQPPPDDEVADPRYAYDFPEPPAWMTDDLPWAADEKAKMVASLGWEGCTG